MSADPGGGVRVERVLLGVLVLVTAVCWSLQFEPFDLPNNDYASFEHVAERLARGQLPGSFVRMPILPTLMAALAPAMPGPHPFLSAALVWNFAFSLALLVALHLLAERTVGRGAILVSVLFAATNQFHSMALQPLVEPSLAFFVVLAFLLCRMRSPWQYAAAGAAAVSRYDAALLLGVLGLVNWLAERRFRRHLALAVACGLPFLAWLTLGVMRGSGAAWYVEDMGRIGFTPAPHFLVTALREPLRGWWGSEPAELLRFAVVIGIPAALGVREALRRFPREAAAMLLYWVLATATVVVLGVDKGRYALPAQWMPILFLGTGLLLPLRPEARARLARLGFWPVALTLCAGATLLAWMVRRWGLRLLADPTLPNTGLDLLWLGVAATVLAIGLLRGLRSARGLARWALVTAALPALLVATPLLGAGMRTKAREQYKIRWGNHGIVLAAAWARENLAPEDRAVVLHKSHYLHLTSWPPARFVPFRDLEAEDAAGLAAEMRARGLTHVFATWRKPPGQPSDQVFEQKFRWFLVDPFVGGGEVPGFLHVATLPLPDHLERPPVEVYRVAPGGPAR